VSQALAWMLFQPSLLIVAFSFLRLMLNDVDWIANIIVTVRYSFKLLRKLSGLCIFWKCYPMMEQR
jgi:hypothetical protein